MVAFEEIDTVVEATPTDEIDSAVEYSSNAVFDNESVLKSEAAFSEWVLTTQKVLIRFCRQIVGDWIEAEDMVQEAYIRAWQKRDSYKGASSLLTWQMAIARRVCIDRLRSRKKVVFIPLDERDASTEHDVDTRIDVQRTLEKLDINDRLILYLRIGEDLPFEDISHALGRSVATCRKKYERAKKRFEIIYSGNAQERNGNSHE